MSSVVEPRGHAPRPRGILDLPLETLEHVLCLLRPGLEELVRLSSVCSAFRAAAARVPVHALHLPVPDGLLRALAARRFPVAAVCCRDRAKFVGYQVRAANLRRLRTAELVAGDYDTGKNCLTQDYVALLRWVTSEASESLRHLLVNLDLRRSDFGGMRGSFRCVDIVLTCKNITFLSIAFKPGIELEQKVTGSRDGNLVIQQIVNGLRKLKSLYIFSCPTERLEIKSESLEKLHVYKSEFATLGKLETPNLVKLMFHGTLSELFSQLLSEGQRGFQGDPRSILKVLYEGCPRLESFNGVDVGCLMGKGLAQEQWCYLAMALCFKKCQTVRR